MACFVFVETIVPSFVCNVHWASRGRGEVLAEVRFVFLILYIKSAAGERGIRERGSDAVV